MSIVRLLGLSKLCAKYGSDWPQDDRGDRDRACHVKNLICGCPY